MNFLNFKMKHNDIHNLTPNSRNQFLNIINELIMDKIKDTKSHILTIYENGKSYLDNKPLNTDQIENENDLVYFTTFVTKR